MKDKIIKLIKKLIGHRILVQPIIDNRIYDNVTDSYSGNSLQSSNVLIISNTTEYVNEISERYKKEGCEVVIIGKEDGNLSLDSIEKARENILGHFDRIVNIIEPCEGSQLMTANDEYNDDDLERMVYQWMQVEVDYLDKNLTRSFLHVVLIEKDMEYIEVLSHSIVNMVRGLAKMLLPHGIICNGVSACMSVPRNAVAKTLMFISSKYGEVIAGEVIQLK